MNKAEAKNAAAELGRKGGKKVMAAMTREQRSAFAKKAAAARWAKQKKGPLPG